MSELNLYQRLAATMSECSYVRKDTTVSGYGAGYTAVSHDAVTAKVRAALLKHGVIATTSVTDVERTKEEIAGKNGTRTVFRTSVTVETTFVNVDDPAQTLTVRAVGTGEDSGDKADGKAVSYAAKYALLKALMLETGDDADKDASIQRAQEVSPQRQRYNAAYEKMVDTHGQEKASDLLKSIKEKATSDESGKTDWDMVISEMEVLG